MRCRRYKNCMGQLYFGSTSSTELIYYSMGAFGHEISKQIHGQGVPITWPLRSPNFTLPDFFLWGRIIGKVHSELTESSDHFRIRLKV